MADFSYIRERLRIFNQNRYPISKYFITVTGSIPLSKGNESVLFEKYDALLLYKNYFTPLLFS